MCVARFPGTEVACGEEAWVRGLVLKIPPSIHCCHLSGEGPCFEGLGSLPPNLA